MFSHESMEEQYWLLYLLVKHTLFIIPGVPKKGNRFNHGYR